MVRLVRVVKSQWSKSQQGVWRFVQDQSVFREDIVLGDTSTIDELNRLVRGWMLEPDGETCPPHNIVANPDIDMLMSVHEWNTEPQICVIFGAEDVARYQFLCRAPFKIGNRTFLGEGITEEQHISAVNDMAHGQELVCSDEVLKEIFSEAEMVSLYRFSFEIERARNRLDLNVGADDITGDHVVPQHIQPPITEPRLVTANQAERVGQLSHTYEADMYGFPSGAWTINNHPAAGHGGGRGSFIPHEQTHYNTTPLPPQVTRTTYWDNLMSSSPNTPIGPPIQFLSDESSAASSVGATTREELGGQKSLFSVASGEISKGTACVQGESSAMGAQVGSKPTDAELVHPQNNEVGSTSAQLTPLRANEIAADVAPAKVEEHTDETERRP
ncbi:hypothetical protein HID58_066958 [Brassica napus]|uniref:Uncharacterized protein n=1 Tax=Brassica napus TaxID=3708 RepID=A0ABQ7ZHD3_BRANA|nr:hypothetical protein HID58_066958 [Brassica napus]